LLEGCADTLVFGQRSVWILYKFTANRTA